jgi:hypothetical protein
MTEMKPHRRGMTITIAALGVAGALAGGAGVAMAVTGPSGQSTGVVDTAATNTATAPSVASGICPFGQGGTVGMGFGQGSAMTAAANYLGLSRSDLAARMHTGQSLADIAVAQGRSVAGLENAITAAVRGDIEANTALTADQKTAMLAQLSNRVDAMVDMTPHAGSGFGGMGPGMMGGR